MNPRNLQNLYTLRTPRMPSARIVLALSALCCASVMPIASHASNAQATNAQTSNAQASRAPATQQTGLTIERAWVRATPPQAPVAGGFLTVRNFGKTPDRLLSVSSPDAERVEIHEMRMDDGVMRMRMIQDGLDIAAGGSLELKPGGYHLMFISPKPAFEVGNTVSATLHFEHAGKRTVRFEVKPMGTTR